MIGAGSGGLIGSLCFNVRLNGCSNYGDIKGINSGGLIGKNCKSYRVYNSYNVGNVIG